MQSQIEALTAQALALVEGADSSNELETIRTQFLGKKGLLADILRGVGKLPAEERPRVGEWSNIAKSAIEAKLAGAIQRTRLIERARELAQDRIDVSLPGRERYRGALHPVTLVTERICTTLAKLGFEVVTGPEIETEYLNFESVNIPEHHPAREMQDTFYISPGLVLRTQTSPVQMRVLQGGKLPLRILSPGAVYRCDHDATHSPMFHQIEGLWVDEGVKMSHLKGVLEFFAKDTFGSKADIRLRPSYFPFVEPGAEVDIRCTICNGAKSNCVVCKGTGWLEVLGAGMVHRKLFQEAGIDRPQVSGFAFGLGVERIAMLLFGVPDLRLFYSGDLRFLSQFSKGGL